MSQPTPPLYQIYHSLISLSPRPLSVNISKKNLPDTFDEDHPSHPSALAAEQCVIVISLINIPIEL